MTTLSLLPRTLDNAYQGRKAALWLLGIALLLVEHFGRKWILPGVHFFHWVLTILLVVGLALSLWRRIPEVRS